MYNTQIKEPCGVRTLKSRTTYFTISYKLLNLYLVDISVMAFISDEERRSNREEYKQIFITFQPYALNQLSHPQNIASFQLCQLPIMKPRVLSVVYSILGYPFINSMLFLLLLNIE